jgi:hypothetical protein
MKKKLLKCMQNNVRIRIRTFAGSVSGTFTTRSDSDADFITDKCGVY